ncbi:MAG: serine dehydratase [Ruminococcaceae bacterium]|nr:serine dehydratase [Oscillospiraceae bacterium]
MQSIREIYRIGRGPSSSHTMGPERACKQIKACFPSADRYRVVLYGSLAKTGEGHGTDRVIRETLEPLVGEVIFDRETPTIRHPNMMDITLFAGEKELCQKRVWSVGGGAIVWDGEEPEEQAPDVYDLSTFADITAECARRNIRLWQYVVEKEGVEIIDYLTEVWETMKAAVNRGISATGILPGGLDTQRRARIIYQGRHIDESPQTKENRLVSAYAFAVGEENAAGGVIVTAPTCGASGVVPAVLRYMQEARGFSDLQIVHALASAGIAGNVIKTNASISGAECGCQAEIGSACSMAAVALAELFEMGFDQIDYAAEVAMEHHLGLTCDPIGGLVQIPCIERNAVAAMRAINALSIANFLADSRKISFDLIVKTMYNTGMDLPLGYRETSTGGLAKYYPIEKMTE